MNNFHNTLQQAIKQAGGVTALARLIAVNRGTIHLYKTDGKMPEWAANAIGRATGVDAELLKTP
jgi:protein involved in polysaccharide export with SLBB domain